MMRRTGKSVAAEIIKEAALNAGQRVVVANRSGATLQRRKKHLTLIEELRPKPGGWRQL